MYSRKIALSLAKQYRRCPPPWIMEDPSQQKALENHRTICSYCSGKDLENRAAWENLTNEMKRIDPLLGKSLSDDIRPVCPGQFRFVRADLGVWRENFFYTPPMVLIMKKTPSVEGAVLVAQTYHDIQMAAPGDLILNVDDSHLSCLFVECWNTYTMKETLLGPSLDTIPQRAMDAVLKCENQPGFCPEWGTLPRPLVENDPRIFFRELELEVAYTFSSRSVLQLMESIEMPPLEQLFSSPVSVQGMIRATVPGTGWKRLPTSLEQAFAMAELPVEYLPLAAANKIANMTTANLIRIETGKVKSINPVGMEIYGQSGGLILSGRVHDLPEDFNYSRFICFLEPEGLSPISPVRCEWKEETGDFIIEFSYFEKIPWHLKAAVVFNSDAK